MSFICNAQHSTKLRRSWLEWYFFSFSFFSVKQRSFCYATTYTWVWVWVLNNVTFSWWMRKFLHGENHDFLIESLLYLCISNFTQDESKCVLIWDINRHTADTQNAHAFSSSILMLTLCWHVWANIMCTVQRNRLDAKRLYSDDILILVKHIQSKLSLFFPFVDAPLGCALSRHH